MLKFNATAILQRLAQRRLTACLVAIGALLHPAAAQELKPGDSVRIQGTPASELSPGWHTGRWITSGHGCVMVLTPDSSLPRGMRALALLYVQKLERRAGTVWRDVPVKPLLQKERPQCREAVGG